MFFKDPREREVIKVFSKMENMMVSCIFSGIFFFYPYKDKVIDNGQLYILLSGIESTLAAENLFLSWC